MSQFLKLLYPTRLPNHKIFKLISFTRLSCHNSSNSSIPQDCQITKSSNSFLTQDCHVTILQVSYKCLTSSQPVQLFQGNQVYKLVQDTRLPVTKFANSFLTRDCHVTILQTHLPHKTVMSQIFYKFIYPTRLPYHTIFKLISGTRLSCHNSTNSSTPTRLPYHTIFKLTSDTRLSCHNSSNSFLTQDCHITIFQTSLSQKTAISQKTTTKKQNNNNNKKKTLQTHL